MTEREWCVARLSELPDPGAKAFTTGAGDWPFRGFVVHWQGEVFAYANQCPHQGHPLNLLPGGFFTPAGDLLICSSHGAVFAPESGRCIGGPCAGAALAVLPCRLEAGEVFVSAPASMRGE